MDEKIESGSTVQLKSGGPVMTVETVSEKNYCRCLWFDGQRLRQVSSFTAPSSPSICRNSADEVAGGEWRSGREPMTKQERREQKPRPVRSVRSPYQPTKAQLEEEMDFSHLEGATPEEMAREVMKPVDITLIDKPEK